MRNLNSIVDIAQTYIQYMLCHASDANKSSLGGYPALTPPCHYWDFDTVGCRI